MSSFASIHYSIYTLFSSSPHPVLPSAHAVSPSPARQLSLPALTLSTFAFIAGCIFALTREGVVIKILLFAAVLLLYLFGIYAFFHRGVAAYKKGKIRIRNVRNG